MQRVPTVSIMNINKPPWSVASGNESHLMIPNREVRKLSQRKFWRQRERKEGRKLRSGEYRIKLLTYRILSAQSLKAFGWFNETVLLSFAWYYVILYSSPQLLICVFVATANLLGVSVWCLSQIYGNFPWGPRYICGMGIVCTCIFIGHR